MSLDVYTPPVRECPDCGARGTLAHRGQDGNVDTVECDPIRADNINPERGGCGYRFLADHGGFASDREDMAARIETLEARLEEALSEANNADTEA